jgi:hypothetical protein
MGNTLGNGRVSYLNDLAGRGLCPRDARLLRRHNLWKNISETFGLKKTKRSKSLVEQCL